MRGRLEIGDTAGWENCATSAGGFKISTRSSPLGSSTFTNKCRDTRNEADEKKNGR
jgi:hypothetical protein